MKSKRSPTADLDTIIPILLGVWRRWHKLRGPPDRLQTREFRSVVTAIEKLRQPNALQGDYFADRDLLGAYLLYQWVIHYQQALSLLSELPKTPKRVLDLCSGPAPFAFAALRHGSTEVYALDRNNTALELGAEVCGRYGLPLTLRRWDCQRPPFPLEDSFDLISIGHALEELFPSTQKGWQQAQQKFVEGLLSRLKPDGHLLLVEGSFGEQNSRLLALRDSLVAKDIAVQAPCVWKGECPALKTPNSPCYAQRPMEKPYLLREIQRAAQINLSSLKMSYVIFCAPKTNWPELGEGQFYRVISPPIDSHLGKRFFLCGNGGKKSLGSRLAEHPPQARAFEYLQRGELIRIEGALEQPHALNIIEGTNVEVAATFGKPLPFPGFYNKEEK